jgi:excisionase family DNA binding protein
MRIARGDLTYITLDEAAQRFNYCPAYVSRLALQGTIGRIKHGRRYYIKLDDLRDYAQRQREPLPEKQVKLKLGGIQ